MNVDSNERYARLSKEIGGAQDIESFYKDVAELIELVKQARSHGHLRTADMSVIGRVERWLEKYGRLR